MYHLPRLFLTMYTVKFSQIPRVRRRQSDRSVVTVTNRHPLSLLCRVRCMSCTSSIRQPAIGTVADLVNYTVYSHTSVVPAFCWLLRQSGKHISDCLCRCTRVNRTCTRDELTCVLLETNSIGCARKIYSILNAFLGIL